MFKLFRSPQEQPQYTVETHEAIQSLFSLCQKDAGTVKAEAVSVESHRLTQEVYKQLERDLLRLAVGPTTTELQAGYQLGVAAVLEKLRNGIVIGG
jgi:hypothetical protein